MATRRLPAKEHRPAKCRLSPKRHIFSAGYPGDWFAVSPRRSPRTYFRPARRRTPTGNCRMALKSALRYWKSAGEAPAEGRGAHSPARRVRVRPSARRRSRLLQTTVARTRWLLRFPGAVGNAVARRAPTARTIRWRPRAVTHPATPTGCPRPSRSSSANPSTRPDHTRREHVHVHG